MAAAASITIRTLDRKLKRALELRATSHGRSIEEEAREILRTALAARSSEHLVERIRRRCEAAGWPELTITARDRIEAVSRRAAGLELLASFRPEELATPEERRRLLEYWGRAPTACVPRRRARRRRAP